MKKQVFAFMIVPLCLAACQKETGDLTSNEPNVILSAQIEQKDATRTTLDESNNVLWSENDQIIGFLKSSYGYKYQILPNFVGKTYADFSQVSLASGGNLSAGVEWDHNVVYYPYSETIECRKLENDYILDVELPSEQTYAVNSFGNGSMAMVAVSETNNVIFKNVLGGIKLQIKGTQKVTSIKIEGKNNEKLSGAAVVTGYSDGQNPSVSMASGASTSVTLKCNEGVQLNDIKATEFIITCPPTSFTKGFKVTINYTENVEQIIETDQYNEVGRSSLLVMPEVTLDTGDIINISHAGTANCYIISEAGNYRFKPTKGNSSESVGEIAIADVLWESFGTSEVPNVGDLVKNVIYKNGIISFEIPESFRKGNAVIVAKDASGVILWSWHIWLTDEPEGQEYFNNAGTMMDRNLGATNATPNDIGAIGLLYQWGRKDPFLGSSSISSNNIAESTITWPSNVKSDSNNGTIEYAIANPTTFIEQNNKNYDWYYTGSSVCDNTRWTTSSQLKSVYDPCPVGWRVPEGRTNGVWAKAYGKDSDYYVSISYGMYGLNFSDKLGSASTIWYPATGSRYGTDADLHGTGNAGYYWSATATDWSAAIFEFSRTNGRVYQLNRSNMAYAYSVRCIQE